MSDLSDFKRKVYEPEVNALREESARLRSALERLRSGAAMWCPQMFTGVALGEHQVRLQFIENVLDRGLSVPTAEADAVAAQEKKS